MAVNHHICIINCNYKLYRDSLMQKHFVKLLFIF